MRPFPASQSDANHEAAANVELTAASFKKGGLKKYPSLLLPHLQKPPISRQAHFFALGDDIVSA